MTDLYNLLGLVKWGFHPTQRAQRKERKGRKKRNATDRIDVRPVTQWRIYWIDLLQTAAANHGRQRRRRMPLARCQPVADTRHKI